MRSVGAIPSVMTVVDADGTETHEPMMWTLMRPPADRCHVCAVSHPPEDPHNADSMYYQMAFNGAVGRTPTWADAMAHCSERVRAVWRALLVERGAWTEPPTGEAPVAHHGVG